MDRSFLSKIFPKKFHRDDISPIIIKSINSIVKNENYIYYTVKVKNINSCGGSYLGNLYEFEIKGRTAQGKNKTDIFVKELQDLSTVRILSIKELYLVENFAYKELSKIFDALQDSASVPPGDRYKMVKMYKETNANAIILENLAKKGFKTCDRLDVIPLRYAELAVQELAKFHGLSFVLEIKNPEYFESKIKSLKHPFKYVDEWNGLVESICNYLMTIYDDDVNKKIDVFLKTFREKFLRFNNDHRSYRCTLTHGDYRMNNVLVREMNGVAQEVMPIDFQLMDYGCPIRDFLFFIFSGTDRAFRNQHLYDLKELYFQTLTKFLNYFDIDVENVYPKKEFEKSYTECLDYGLIKVMYASAFLFAPASGADLQNMADIKFRPNKKVEMKIRELIEDFAEWGYL